MIRLFTFLEDRRILFSQIWGQVGFESPGSVISVREIRQRLTNDLQQIPRDSGLANSIRRMQEACKKLLDAYDSLCRDKSSTVLSSTETHELVSKFRGVFRRELVTLSEVYGVDMYRLIPSQETLEKVGSVSEEDFLFSDKFEHFSLNHESDR